MYIVSYIPYTRDYEHIEIEVCNDIDELWSLLVDDLGLINGLDEDYILDENGEERPRFLSNQDVIDYLNAEFVGDGSFSVVAITISDGKGYLLQE